MPLSPSSVGLSRRAVLSAAPASLFGGRAAAEPPAPRIESQRIETALAQLDRIAKQALAKTGIPGMAVAIVYRDEVRYIEGFGVREAGKPALVDPETIFQLASVSKPIATTVVAALVGEGIVGWDDPIVSHDPGFEMFDAWVTREITPRDMFAHRSGLPDHAGDLLEDIGYDRGAVLRRLRFEQPGSSFRSHYAYTNFGFTEGAVAAAMAAGNAWEEVSAERLYRPLGMRRTSSRYSDFAAAANRAHLHVRIDGKWVAKYARDPDAQSPAGGVSASVRDLAQWLRLQLGRGEVDGKRIVAAKALDETHRPQIVRAPPPDPAAGHAGFYGLGWNIDYDAAGRVQWSHSGGFDLGAATCVMLLPAEHLGIAALTNAQPIGVPEAISRSFFDLVLDGKVERDWLSLYGGVFQNVLAPGYAQIGDGKELSARSPALPAAAYLGLYENPLFGKIEIAGAEDALLLKLGPRLDPYPLRHFDRDVFAYEPPGENAAGASAVRFAIGAEGRAATVTIDNLDIHGQGRFTRLGAK